MADSAARPWAGELAPLAHHPAEAPAGTEAFSLSEEQLEVVRADPGARIVVEAGPGTGKTETVAHRLASLLKRGLRPSQILVLSFSRNAVATLTGRLERMKGDVPEQVEELRHLTVRTFDSWSFRMLRQLNLSHRELISRSHDANIDALVRYLRVAPKDQIEDKLSGIRHVVVDEFQDVGGVRGALVLELLDLLAPVCGSGAGYTVLGDPAQAIYGFSLREGPEEYRPLTSGALIAELRKRYGHGLQTLRLRRNFRAPGDLGNAVARLRNLLLDLVDPEKRLVDLTQATAALPELPMEGPPSRLLGPALGSAAILTSTNGEAIQVAQSLFDMARRAGGLEIRLHTRGQPVVVPAWMGATLGKMQHTTLRNSQFRRIYENLYAGSGQPRAKQLGVPPVEVAWGRLARAAGEQASATSLDLQVLRTRLQWCDLLPDDEDIARQVVHVMTIHQSKGMEFDAVALMANKVTERTFISDAEKVEAANVLFVGMSRAAKQLFRIPSDQDYSSLKCMKFKKKRKRWCGWRAGSASLEVGLAGDIDPVSFIDSRVVGGEQQVSKKDVPHVQQKLAEDAHVLMGQEVCLCRWPTPGNPDAFVYRIHLLIDGQPELAIGAASEQLTHDLLHMIHRHGYVLPPTLMGLRISDVVTFGQQQELPQTAAQPWATSGLWLGVNLVGAAYFALTKRRIR